jgi:hypothetical protein
VTIHPIPADFLKDASVHACRASVSVSGGAQGVRSLGRGLILSRVCPSLTKRPFPEAPRNHKDMRRRDESSFARGGRRARLGASMGARLVDGFARYLRRLESVATLSDTCWLVLSITFFRCYLRSCKTQLIEILTTCGVTFSTNCTYRDSLFRSCNLIIYLIPRCSWSCISLTQFR